MRRIIGYSLLFLTLPLLLTLVGCGGGGSTSTQRQQIAVSVSPSSATVSAGGTQQFTATVTGTTATAVSWSVSGCTGDGCGTISATGLYTAPSLIPSDATVMVTATLQSDSSKRGQATVHHVAIEVDIPETTVTLNAGETHQFTANVTGISNTAVTWNLSGCTGTACGTISSAGLYTAPPSLTLQTNVTVTATSQADPTKSDSATVQLMPPAVAVLISPKDVTVKTGLTQNFTATIQNDVNGAGVTWSLGAACTTACGTLSSVTNTSVTYTAPSNVPSPATMTLTATAVADTSKSASARITVVGKSLPEPGDYAFVFHGWQVIWLQDWTFNWYATPYSYVVAGRFHLDGNGNITEGIEDINAQSGVSLSLPFTGTYSVGADRRGTFTIITAKETATYHMTVDGSGKKASFIRYDSPAPAMPAPSVTGSGYFELQDSSAFSLSALAGQYAIGISEPRLAAIGRFTADATGTLSRGTMDVLDSGSSYSSLTVTGKINSPSSSTGRGTATFTLTPAPGSNSDTVKFTYYIISANKMVLVQTDTAGTGEIARQTGSYSVASFNDPVIFQMSGGNGDRMLAALAGQISPNGAGALTGTIDQNLESSITLNQALSGNYIVEASGRCRMTLNVGGTTKDVIAYFFGDNEAFAMQTTGSDVLYGSFKPQSGGPFSNSSLASAYTYGTGLPIRPFSENDAGLITFDGGGNFTLVADYNFFDGNFSDVLGQNNVSGTYDVAANGRGTMNLPGGTTFGIWMISPNEIVAIATTRTDDQLPVLLKFGK